MADSPTAAASIRHAAEYLRRDADLSESLGRAVMLNPAEVRALMLAVADWLGEEAADLAEFEAETGPIGEPLAGHWAHALKVARLYLRDGWRADT